MNTSRTLFTIEWELHNVRNQARQRRCSTPTRTADNDIDVMAMRTVDNLETNDMNMSEIPLIICIADYSINLYTALTQDGIIVWRSLQTTICTFVSCRDMSYSKFSKTTILLYKNVSLVPTDKVTSIVVCHIYIGEILWSPFVGRIHHANLTFPAVWTVFMAFYEQSSTSTGWWCSQLLWSVASIVIINVSIVFHTAVTSLSKFQC